MPASTPDRADSIRIVPLQHLGAGDRWRTEAMRSYRIPLLLWVTRGQGRITVAGINRGYGPNTAVFIPPRHMHGFETSAAVYGSAIFFDQVPTGGLPDQTYHMRLRDQEGQSAINALLDALQREAGGNLAHRGEAMAHLAGLLAVWLNRQVATHSDSDPARNTAENLLARRFTRSIEEQIFTGQTIDNYAESLGVSVEEIDAACRTSCGRPAQDILLDRLQFEAHRLRRDSSLPANRIAELLGTQVDLTSTLNEPETPLGSENNSPT